MRLPLIQDDRLGQMTVTYRLPDRKALATELSLLGRDFHKLKDHELFVAWFLFAYITGDRQDAVNALTGSASEKGVDGLYIDRKAKLVCVVQGKYRSKLLASSESRSSMEEFAGVAQHLVGPDADFADFCIDLEPIALRKLKEARKCILTEDFRLILYFATLGRVTRAVRSDAAHLAKRSGSRDIYRPQLVVADGRELMTILADYLDGVAPPVPRAELLVIPLQSRNSTRRRVSHRGASQYRDWRWQDCLTRLEGSSSHETFEDSLERALP